MRLKYLIFGLILQLSFTSFAQDMWTGRKTDFPVKEAKDLKFYGYFINQFVVNNIYATNDFLKGQTVGRLYGGNTTTSSDTNRSIYAEQRFIPFFEYRPSLLNRKVAIRAAFEIDWTWGDVAYGAGGNLGGGFSADQVNIQTQLAELEFSPKPNIQINLGMTRLFDTPKNPFAVSFNNLTKTGTRMHLFGSEAVGTSINYAGDDWCTKAGFYWLYSNNIKDRDDVTVFEAQGQKDFKKNWSLGGSFYYLRDRSHSLSKNNINGGVSILGQGLRGSLADYNGTYNFNVVGSEVKGDFFWLSTFWGKNEEYNTGRFMHTGYITANLGIVDTNRAKWTKDFSIAGVAANAKIGYRYGQTYEDRIELDAFFSTGDNNTNDGRYSGVITGNQWGSPGALFLGTEALLLFPQPNVVNRYFAAVTDISNQGLGLIGTSLHAHKDIIPNKLSAKIGTATALSVISPKNGTNYMGTEISAAISWQPKILMNLELHGGYLMLGNFYKDFKMNGIADGVKPTNPWTLFLVYKWLIF